MAKYDPINFDLTGHIFGRWTVLKRVGGGSRGNFPKWLCRCQCGTERIIPRGRLLSGESNSCGCLQREVTAERLATHGRSNYARNPVRDKTYAAWQSAKARCFNPNATSYSDYGARGITMCDAWRNSFEQFARDMGDSPEGSSIERIDVNGDYEPGNCVWSTPVVQGRNKRSNRLLTLNGETACLSEWEARTGLDHRVIQLRLKRGWSVEKALTTPLRSELPSRRRPAR